MDITSILESILFVASKPLAVSKISKIMDVQEGDLKHALKLLEQKYSATSGIHIVRSGDMVQMASNPKYAEFVEQFTTSEMYGELTKPQLETLTVIAYRGPITRPELEEIRGVNCSVILRNLMIRGLVVEHDGQDSILSLYELSIDALRHLGISSVKDLPDFEALHTHTNFLPQDIQSET